MINRVRAFLPALPGCFSSVIAFMTVVTSLTTVVGLSQLGKKTPPAPPPAQVTVNFPDPNDLATAPIFEGTYERPLDYSDPLLAERKIVLSSNLNPGATRAVVSKLLYLNAKSPKKPINLYLRSNGGNYNDAFAIIDTMRLIDVPVNVWAVGGCQSAGTVILTSATGLRIASRNAQIMVHADLDVPTSAEKNNEEAMNRERVGALYKKRAHLPDNWYPLTGGKKYYISAQSAHVYGIIDEIR